MISLFNADDFNNIKRFVCIGAHSDDIEMRCGGVFARLVRQGAQGLSVIAVDGPYIRGDKDSIEPNITSAEQNIERREAEARAGARCLGASNVEFLHLHPYHFYEEKINNNDFHARCPDFSSYENAASILKNAVFTGKPFVTYARYNENFMEDFKKMINEWKPDVIFTHSLADRHPDHFAVADLVFRLVTELELVGDVPVFQWHSGSYGQMQYYQPTHYVELSEEDVNKAQAAMKVFSSQFEPEVLSDYVGISARTFGRFAGLEYAQPLTITNFPKYCQINNPEEYFQEAHKHNPEPVLM
jgi:LmbE family N-acetylglucosaminyl deacetylase